MGSQLTFPSVEAFEKAYGGEQTFSHEKAALERSGAQDDFCMICHQKNKKLYPELSPGEIHYCPRKWCSDCVEVPNEWKYQGKPKITDVNLDCYFYYPAECWICLKRGWNLCSPLLSPSNPEWKQRDEAAHKIIARMRYEEWRDGDGEDTSEDAPRFKYQKLPDKFSEDPDQQLKNDRQLFQAMKLDVLKAPFGPWLPGGRSASQSNFKDQPAGKTIGRPRKFQEQGPFDANKAFEGSCRFLLDVRAGKLEEKNTNGRSHRTRPRARRDPAENDVDEHEDNATDLSDGMNGVDDPPYNPRSTRSRNSRAQRPPGPANAAMRSSTSHRESTSQEAASQQDTTIVTSDPPSTVEQLLADIDDSKAVDVAIENSKVVILKNDWKEKCLALASELLKREGTIVGERSRTAALMAAAGLLEVDLDQQSAVALAAEAKASRLDMQLQDLTKQYNVSAQICDELRLKIVEGKQEVEKVGESLATEKAARKSEATALRRSLQQSLEEIGNVKSANTELSRQQQPLVDQVAALQLQTAEVETQIEDLKKKTTELTMQNKVFENQKAGLKEHNSKLTDQNLALTRESNIAALNAKSLETMLTRSLDITKARQTSLDEEREELGYLRGQLVALESIAAVLRRDCAAYGFELGRALRMTAVSKAELTRRLTFGHISESSVFRLLESPDFNILHTPVPSTKQPFPTVGGPPGPLPPWSVPV